MEGDEEMEGQGQVLNKMKTPNNTITLNEFNEICKEKLELTLNNETFELIFYVFDRPTNLENVEIDFNLFARLFYLIYKKYELANLDASGEGDEFLINSEGNGSKLINHKDQFNEYSISKEFDDSKKEDNGDYEDEGEGDDDLGDEEDY